MVKNRLSKWSEKAFCKYFAFLFNQQTEEKLKQIDKVKGINLLTF